MIEERGSKVQQLIKGEVRLEWLRTLTVSRGYALAGMMVMEGKRRQNQRQYGRDAGNEGIHGDC